MCFIIALTYSSLLVSSFGDGRLSDYAGPKLAFVGYKVSALKVIQHAGG